MSELDSHPAPADSEPIEVTGHEAALDLPLNRRVIDRLFRVGAIDDSGRQEALRLLNGPVVWWPWIDKALLFLGLALALTGIICFFAWNWDHLPGIAKLGIIQLGLATCCGVALWKGLETTIGKAAQTGACVLVGVFLAVFGQIYQTGADEWLLFAGWAGLILPWTAIARFDALWILWLAIVNVAMWLCWEQTLSVDIHWEFLAITLGLLNGTTLGLKESGQQRGIDWLQKQWPRQLLLPATLTPLISPVLVMIVDPGIGEAVSWLAGVVFVGVLGVTYFYYRHRNPDLFAVSCCMASVCVVATFLAGKLLFEIIDDEFAMILLGGVIIAVVTTAARWLMAVARQFQETAPEETVI